MTKKEDAIRKFVVHLTEYAGHNNWLIDKKMLMFHMNDYLDGSPFCICTNNSWQTEKEVYERYLNKKSRLAGEALERVTEALNKKKK